MTRKVIQIRYYNENDNKNYPPLPIVKQDEGTIAPEIDLTRYSEDIGQYATAENLKTGVVFQNYMPLASLGIQTMPGVKFYLNRGAQPVIVGSTGIYEIDAKYLADINWLAFDQNSIKMIQENESAYIIVDILYETQE